MFGIYFTKRSPHLSSQIVQTNIKDANTEFKILEKQYLNISIELVYHSDRAIEDVFYENENQFIFIDGYVLGKNREKLSARETFNLFRLGMVSPSSLNGEFFILSRVDSNIQIFSDIGNQRQHYYFDSNEEIIISPSLGFILNQMNNRAVNIKSLLYFIFFNKLRNFDQTIWEKIKIIPPNSLLSVTKRIQIISQGDIFVSQENGKTIDPDFLAEVYKKSTGSRIANLKDYSLTLSGGLDSRSILAATPSAIRKNILYSTMSEPGTDEIEIAQDITKNLKLNHFVHWIYPISFLGNLHSEYLFKTDLDLYGQLEWFNFLGDLKERGIKTLVHGLDLDVTLGGIYLTDEIRGINKIDDFKKYILKNTLSADLEVLNKIIDPKFLKQYDFDITEELNNILKNLIGESFITKYDYFIQKFSMQRVIINRYSIIRNFTETITPMYDLEFISLLYGSDISNRYDYNLFLKVFERLDSKLLKFKYQRTGLPANTPFKFWKENIRIQSMQEELYRKISGETNGLINIPFKKHYTNIDEWMRLSPEVVRIITEKLLSNSNRLSKILNYDALNEVLRKHINHEKSFMKIIHVLFSAEVFLEKNNIFIE